MATQRELDHQYRMRIVQVVQDALARLGNVACVAIVGLTMYFCSRELAGKVTFADIAFKFVTSMAIDKPIGVSSAWLLSAALGIWGCAERFLRRRYIKKMHPIVERYQSALDAGRGSSKLTDKGTTRREDI
jgi:hypothetical protein